MALAFIRTSIPGARLAQTAITTTALLDATFVNIPLKAPYVISTTGYYWLAIMQDSSAVFFAVTNLSFRANYLPVRREAGAGLTLPATAGILTNPVSALIYVSALE